MTSLEEITIVSRQHGSDRAGHAIGEGPSRGDTVSAELQDTNDPNDLERGALDQGSLMEPGEDARRSEELGDLQRQQVRLTPGGRYSRPEEAGGQDIDFAKKLDGDLNITLIIAGLFAAVASAFIIYIHPQLQPDPNEETAALLRVLLYKMDNTTFGVDVPQVPRWAGPPPTIVAAQLLLYLSLVVTLQSVLIAILAKQMLNLYSSVGTWGSTAKPDRGRRRELKRFGFKLFSAVLHLTVLLPSILLHSALFLLTCALLVYLWKINIVIASVVLVVTFPNTIFYFFFWISAGANFLISHFRVASVSRLALHLYDL